MIRSRRKKPRPGRLKGEELGELRLACWLRDQGVCQRCGKVTKPELNQEHPDSFHMAHRRNKRMWGDNLENLDTECGGCHRTYHQNGPSMEKICPSKRPKP